MTAPIDYAKELRKRAEVGGITPIGSTLLLGAADEIARLRDALRSCYYGGLSNWTKPMLDCVTSALGIEKTLSYPVEGNDQCAPAEPS